MWINRIGRHSQCPHGSQLPRQAVRSNALLRLQGFTTVIADIHRNERPLPGCTHPGAPTTSRTSLRRNTPLSDDLCEQSSRGGEAPVQTQGWARHRRGLTATAPNRFSSGRANRSRRAWPNRGPRVANAASTTSAGGLPAPELQAPVPGSAPDTRDFRANSA